MKQARHNRNTCLRRANPFCFRMPACALRLFPAILLALVFVTGCATIHTAKNYQGFLPGRDIAVLRERGFQIWLAGSERRPVDELRLLPGRYLISFFRYPDRSGGVANCLLEPGTLYGLRIVRREYLPQSGTNALVAECPIATDQPADFAERVY